MLSLRAMIGVGIVISLSPSLPYTHLLLYALLVSHLLVHTFHYHSILTYLLLPHNYKGDDTSGSNQVKHYRIIMNTINDKFKGQIDSYKSSLNIHSNNVKIRSQRVTKYGQVLSHSLLLTLSYSYSLLLTLTHSYSLLLTHSLTHSLTLLLIYEGAWSSKTRKYTG